MKLNNKNNYEKFWQNKIEIENESPVSEPLNKIDEARKRTFRDLALGVDFFLNRFSSSILFFENEKISEPLWETLPFQSLSFNGLFLFLFSSRNACLQQNMRRR